MFDEICLSSSSYGHVCDLSPKHSSVDPHCEGAILVRTADDMDRRLVKDLLSPTAVAVDEIIRQAGLALVIVQTVLLELEFAGRLERHAGGRISLIV